MDILQELLGPVPVHEFLHRTFTRVPFAMPDQAARYRQEFTEADLAAVVEQGRSVLRIVRNGRMVLDQARLSWPEARAYYQQGCTLLLRYTERSSAKFQALAEAFAQFFHAPVDIQVYLTPDRSQAFGWHYDLEEVFIIQVQGCKEYTLRQNTLHPCPVWETMPASMAYEQETSRLQMRCRLEAGDWLYIPSGWWHIARTQAASLHLSIGVMPVTRLTLFPFLAHYLPQFPFWRQRLALVQPGEASGAPSQAHDQQSWDELRMQLHTLLAQESTYQAFLAYLVAPQRAQRDAGASDCWC
ncbi:MAG: cupin domain-containing protein [Candidatus Tectimicrobiota bacterium]